MVVSIFSLLDKDGRERFFEKSFLLANIKPNTVLRIPFLTISNANFDFQAQNLQWRSYLTRDALSTTKQVELIGKKEFAAVALDPEYKAFVIYVATLSVDSGDEMHPSKRVQIAHLKADIPPPEVLSKDANFTDFFSPKLATELPEYRINNHNIELVDDRQLPYGLIYCLGLVELEILKAYIEKNLANSFIRPSKSPAKAPIFFDKKPDSSLRLCVDYQGLNNLTIKN